MIPLYVYPTSNSGVCTQSDYISVGSSAIAKKTIVVVNPNNGPSTSKDSGYTACITYLRSKGVKVVGYVHTKVGYPDITGYRNINDVKTDIDTWFKFYTIDGIFVDEVSNQWPASYETQSTIQQFYG